MMQIVVNLELHCSGELHGLDLACKPWKPSTVQITVCALGVHWQKKVLAKNWQKKRSLALAETFVSSYTYTQHTYMPAHAHTCPHMHIHARTRTHGAKDSMVADLHMFTRKVYYVTQA